MGAVTLSLGGTRLVPQFSARLHFFRPSQVTLRIHMGFLLLNLAASSHPFHGAKTLALDVIYYNGLVLHNMYISEYQMRYWQTRLVKDRQSDRHI